MEGTLLLPNNFWKPNWMQLKDPEVVLGWSLKVVFFKVVWTLVSKFRRWDDHWPGVSSSDKIRRFNKHSNVILFYEITGVYLWSLIIINYLTSTVFSIEVLRKSKQISKPINYKNNSTELIIWLFWLTHYCLTATIVVIVLSKFRFQKKKGSRKNFLWAPRLWVRRRWEPIFCYISKFDGIKVSGINGLIHVSQSNSWN